jgi:hypothetical protein
MELRTDHLPLSLLFSSQFKMLVASSSLGSAVGLNTTFVVLGFF